MLKSINNNKLFGYEEQSAAFLKSYKSGRMHHAWLLAGEEGIGKATFGFHLAKFLLSAGADSFSFNPEDIAVRRIEQMTHSDFYLVNAENDEKKNIIAVDAVREISNFIRMTPVESGWRVVLIDSIDLMNVNASNALLKILEEPTKNSVFILVCHSLSKILPTIRSRCNIMRISKPDVFEPVIKHLIPSIQEEELNLLERSSSGIPGVALSIHNNQAAEVLSDVERVILNEGLKSPLDKIERIKKIADFAAKTNENWKIITRGIVKTISEKIKSKINALRIVRAQDIEEEMGYLDNTRKMLLDAEAISLDKQKTILSVLM